MSFSVSWDETSPSGSQDISLGDDRIREFKKQVRERMAIDHIMAAADSAQTGFHQQVTLYESTSDPLQVSNALVLYSKNAGGARELFTRHESAILQQLTKNGQIWLNSAVMDLQTQGDLAYFDGTKWNRLVMGTALQRIRVNDLGTNLEYFTAPFTTAASQDEMEAAASDTVVVTPFKVKNCPLVAKAWCVFNGTTTGTNAPTSGSNVTSVTREQAGVYTINFTDSISSVNYGVQVSTSRDNDINSASQVGYYQKTASSVRVLSGGNLTTPTDAQDVTVVIYGDF